MNHAISSKIEPSGNKPDKERFREIVRRFKGKRVSVVGDVMLDRFIYGRATRISQEAPVPVLELAKEGYCLGGAANVAAHMLSYGASGYLTGLIGRDTAARVLRTQMRLTGLSSIGLVEDVSRPTTEKTRVVAGSQQIVRIDNESCQIASPRISSALQAATLKELKRAEALIFVDYGKGSLSSGTVMRILREARQRGIPTLVNPKLEYKMFKGVTLFTPNEKEAFEMTGESNSAFGARALQKALLCPVLITEGARGMTLYESAGKTHFEAAAREVYDQAGASDTVTATAAIALAAGASMIEAAYLANMAAGIVVGKRGVSTVEREELEQAIESIQG